jgi:hypothetical protein
VKSEEGDVQLSFRVKPERKRKVKEWVAKHDTNMQALLEKALALAMKEEKPIADGQKRLFAKEKQFTTLETISAYNLHNALFRGWIDRLALILSSGNRTSIEGIACNIDGFLAKLHLVQDQERRTNANYPEDAPDYAVAAKESDEALEQLRRYFAAKRKNS